VELGNAVPSAVVPIPVNVSEDLWTIVPVNVPCAEVDPSENVQPVWTLDDVEKVTSAIVAVPDIALPLALSIPSPTSAQPLVRFLASL
jgi:hypothetical protein